MKRIFSDRQQAAHALAERLSVYKKQSDVILLAIPYGGIPITYEIARHLNLAFQILPTQQLHVPEQQEVIYGTLISGGTRIINQDVVDQFHMPLEEIDKFTAIEKEKLKERESFYHEFFHSFDLQEKKVILIDDGIVTGTTMRAAIMAVQQWRPSQLVVAVPVGRKSSCEFLKSEVDQLICLYALESLRKVSDCYHSYPTVTDEEVCRFLKLREENENGKPDR